MPKKPKEEKIYIPKNTAELLPFICTHKGLFYMSDKSYVDIMQIVTKDLISASESEIEFDMLQFEKFYKMYAADCKIIGINFPTDTKRQQQYFQHKINTTDNPLFKEIVQTKYEELVDVNLYYTECPNSVPVSCTHLKIWWLYRSPVCPQALKKFPFDSGLQPMTKAATR